MPNLYGHHRQTSIVNSSLHSRNGSYPDAPLSPAIIAAAGASMRHGHPNANDDATANMTKNDIASSASASTTSLNTINTSYSNFSTASTLKPERGQGSSEGPGHGGRMERMHSNSGRVKRDRSRHHSHSRQSSHARPHRQDTKPVGEYALHVLFNSFIAQADDKIAQCITTPLDPEPQIERIAGEGVDPNFDQLIEALGHIASPKPKMLIDALMLWRKKKSDEAAHARQLLQQQRSQVGPYGVLPRRNTEPGQSSEPANPPPFNSQSLAAMQIQVAQGERRSTVSIYMLCRVLTEVIGASTLANITPEMEEKLEGIIFSQLKIADPDSLASSPLKLANWHLFSQLLGVMSDINFDSVAGRFIGDLEKSLLELDGKNPANRETEGRTELVLGGMKHLRIKTEPADAWARSCEFLLHLARFFQKSHGRKVKYACCQILDTLLLPIAAIGTAQLTTLKWQEFLATAGNRLSSLIAKPGHWPVAFPVTATLLCVSPPEQFSAQWLQLILPLGSKLKDRITRASCLQVISRLLWTYLYRCNNDNPNATYRKLEEVVRLVLPPGKKTHTTDPSIVDPLIEIIRIIGYKHQDFCFRTIIFPLINSELFAHGKDVHSVRVDQLEPEKMVIGIRAFLAIMADLEKGEEGRPPFPKEYRSNLQSERLPVSPIMATPKPRSRPVTPTPGAERLSHPVAMSTLNDVSRSYYKRFCEILGKITIICDETFGGQAVLDEKFAPPVPKTPIAETFNFSRRDDLLSPVEQKHGFYELLHVAVQALPRCLSADIPFNSLINLLCTGTAHVQHKIAESSAQSIKSIARQSHAQQVTIGFARFIFSFDDKYSTMSDGGMLGPTHVENTLKLYVELLEIWIAEIKQRTKEMAASSDDALDKRMASLDTSGIWAHVEEVESHGLFFLCSQSRKVRAFAITVLSLIRQFDAALGQENVRLIEILEGDSMTVMDLNGENLSVAERSRLQRNMKNDSSQSALIELCSSEVSYDTTLWFKVFPNLMRISFDRCPVVVTLARELICNRILQMYKSVAGLSETRPGYHQYEVSGSRMGLRATTTPPEVMVEQWKLYLIVACTTLTNKGAQPLPAPEMKDHMRKGSKSAAAMAPPKINSAANLFKYVLPLLSTGHPLVRDAVVVALGSINKNIYPVLLDELGDPVGRCNDDARSRIHQRSASSPKRNKKMDILRTEVTHVYKLTAHFLREKDICSNDEILNNLVTYAKDLKLFLMDGEIQPDWSFQKLRRHYCGFMEELFEGINRTADPSRWMTFEMRKSSFALMEDWCGYSPNQEQLQQRENKIREAMIGQQTFGDRPMFTATMEKEKNALKTAALSAMATLCGGPISVTTESKANLQFDIRRMLLWMDTMFTTESDRVHAIGRRALSNLVMHNKEYPYLLEHSISRCYMAEQPKALQSHFEVVTQILIDNPDYPIPFWRILGIGLFTLGSEISDIRSKSAAVLRTLEERQQRNSKIQDFDISISDKTKAVYKLAQFEISKRLASQHSEVAFLIFSEFTVYFKALKPMAQQNMVAAILPWIQTIELQVDHLRDPTPQSYVILANLFEITIKSSSALHNEVQALWQALATGPHPGNVKLVLDFIVQLCLDRREQNFVEYSKQIVVFLSSTPAGIKVVDALIMNINCKDMIPHDRKKLSGQDDPAASPELAGMPYVADLSQALPVGQKQAAFSLGQLSLILLVDLMVSPVTLDGERTDKVPLLLQAVIMLWDCHTPLVQDQAREMLIHLIHELVISKIDDDVPTTPSKGEIEELIESIRRSDPDIVWGYDDNRGKIHDRDNKLPSGMEILATKVASTFAVTYPSIQEEWSRLSLIWAASCSVFHLACRSFQIFRCISTSLDEPMLGNMLARLSSTIANDEPDHQTFSIEVLTTLKTLISKLDPMNLLNFPQLFWTACASLDTTNELEFVELLAMLDELLMKLDLGNPKVIRILFDGQPRDWEGTFEGLQPLVYKGMRSSNCLDKTLATINKLVQIPSGDLVGNDNRLLFAVLANFPSFLQAMEQPNLDPAVAETANTLALIADGQGCEGITAVLSAFASSRISSSEFLLQLVAALRDNFFPYWDFQTLKFLMGFLTNSIPWFKSQTMKLLCVIIPEIDMRNPEIAQHGPDMISPLLRLLQTEYCMDALKVLDRVMTMTGTSNDAEHLRMSMFGGRTSKAQRKEFADKPNLFGIPEDSGWSIPMPAKYKETVQHNVHATFAMCDMRLDAESGAPGTDAETPELEFGEFHNDEGDHFEYFDFQHPGLERADTMMSDEVNMNGHIGDLVSKLDSLDDFFDDIQSPTSDGRSSRTITEFNGDFDGGAELYEEQTLPILAESLGGQGGHPNLQNGFADMHSRPPLGSGFNPGGFNSINPGAFNMMSPSSGNPAHLGAALGRPSMHSRSVTSPSAPSPYPPEFSDDEHGPGVFSDGDQDIPRANHFAGPTASGNESDSGFSFGEGASSLSHRGVRAVRRLTGGRTRENDRSREVVRAMAGPRSPRVPRVPREYLAHAMPQMPSMGIPGAGSTGGSSGSVSREKSPGEAM